MNGLGWDGPVGLSCDDTKLLSALRMYWDGTKHVLVGGTDRPIEVADPEQVQIVMNDSTITKGTKVRL